MGQDPPEEPTVAQTHNEFPLFKESEGSHGIVTGSYLNGWIQSAPSHPFIYDQF
jgi:hypothetical protein